MKTPAPKWNASGFTGRLNLLAFGSWVMWHKLATLSDKMMDLRHYLALASEFLNVFAFDFCGMGSARAIRKAGLMFYFNLHHFVECRSVEINLP
jgi:hypothetical protein